MVFRELPILPVRLSDEDAGPLGTITIERVADPRLWDGKPRVGAHRRNRVVGTSPQAFRKIMSEVRPRMVIVTDDGWPVPGPNQQPPPDPSRPNPMSAAITAGKWDVTDVEKGMLDAWMELHGLEGQDWRQRR